MPRFLTRALGLGDGGTQTSQAEGDCLARHAANRRRLVAIGMWDGVTAARLRRAMAPNGVLLAVHPFPNGWLGFSAQRKIARRGVERVSNGSVRWVRATGYEAGRAYAATGKPLVDFLFIDGDQSYGGLSGDWTAWSPLVAVGGIVALHDSRSTAERPLEEAGSVRFTSAVILKDTRFAVLDAVGSLAVLTRTR